MTTPPARRLLAACTVLALAACNGSPTDPWPQPAPELLGDDTFSRFSLSQYDEHTASGEVQWRIHGGELVGVGRADQAVLIRKGLVLDDAFVQGLTSRADDGGLVLRFQDEENYYLLAFRDDEAPEPRGERNLAVYRRVGEQGAFHEIWTQDVPWPRGQARVVRFSAAGDELSVHLDGQLVGTVTDPYAAVLGSLPAGGVGVRHYGGDAAWITRMDAFGWGAAR